MSSQFPASIDRRTVTAFLRRVIAAAEALPRDRLHQRAACPAGIPLDLWFDTEAEADLNAPRLADAETHPRSKPTRIYVLSAAGLGLETPPSWGDPDCDAATFHAILSEAGLCGAYPFRPQEWLALDTTAGIGLQLARAPADLPAWFAGAPLRQHLHWLLRARGDRIAHAASLGCDGRGILLLGHGGAGKSGTTLAGLAAGLQTVGDDYLALSGTAPAVARSLFRIAKQDRAGLARTAQLAERLAHLPLNWMNKVEFDPTTIFPDCFADALRIDAIVLPRVAHAQVPRFAAATPGEAMRVLIPSNLFQFPGEPIDGLDYYADLVRGAPVHHLELSDSAADNGAALAEFVAALA
ncbi:phosphoenolpyruvate carboxykinase (ATP) [Dongia deserti]|uniref:hypothetical protein n=1 Tax=Dongia deserti TaxID=2268030 RepID=UPI000E64D182|nr:hypothetical protein [Dongia deserti]